MAGPAQSSTASGALVLGGSYRALGVVRSLGRRGIAVWALEDEHLLAGVSRYVARRLAWPSGSEDEQVGFLLDLAERCHLRGWTLFPTDDETAALLARRADALSERYLLAASSWQAMRWAYDKRLTHRLAGELGIPTPWTAFPGTPAGVAALTCDFPVILKAAIRRERTEFTADKAWRVDDRAALLDRFRQASASVAPELVMVQEMIPGDSDGQVSYAALCQDGRVIVSLTARRTRRSPMDFGNASTYVETIDDAEVEAPATLAIERMRYTGLVEIEFKRDVRDGRAKVLDINPRVWGWHTLGSGAGFDFTHLHWRLLHGDAIEPARAPAGLRWVRMATDLPVAVREMAGGRLSPGSYLRGLRQPLDHAIFASDDPLPFLLDVPLFLLLSARRAMSADLRRLGRALARRRATTR